MTEFNSVEQQTIKRAKEFEAEAKKLRKLADAERAARLERESAEAAVRHLRAEINRPGTPEWQRERQLIQERQTQMDRDREAMMRHGIDTLLKHVRANASIYNFNVSTTAVSGYGGPGFVKIEIFVKPR